MLEGQNTRCIRCGHCVAFCPHGASSLQDVPMDKAIQIDRALLPSPEAVDQLIKTRRSIRSFADKPVPNDVIEAVIAAGSYMPTAKNQRKVRWVAINSAETLERIKALMADFFDRWAAMEPVTPEKRAGKVLANMWRKGQDPFLRGARQMVVAVVQADDWGKFDAAIALTYFELAAHARGVGCCWAGYFTSACQYTPELLELLGVKEGEMVGGAQLVGYPKIKPSYTAPRASFPVHWLE